MTPLTIDQFNKAWREHERTRLAHIHVHTVKGFRVTKHLTKRETREGYTENGTPYSYSVTTKGREVPDMDGLNKAIVAWLKVYTNPIKAQITNTKGNYIPKVGFVANKERGRADITAQYADFELCIETKQRTEKQLKSQKEFEQMTIQQSFRKYLIVRDWIDFQEKMIFLFNLADEK